MGGTWFENRYPGCACDVPSHNYVFSFEPKPDFSSVYAGSKEICGYFQAFVDKYQLQKYLQLSHRIECAEWSEPEGIWNIKARNTQSGELIHDWCHILVQGTGYLNKPAWPTLPSLDLYTGTKLHSANYDESVSLKDKEVLLIGGSSSAVQILPAIQPIAKSVKIFIRSPVWVLPDISSEAAAFSPEQIEAFLKEPNLVLELRQANERTMNSIFSVYLKGTILQEQCKRHIESEMRRILQDPLLEAGLIPNFSVGCKRVIPSGFKYLKALKQDNVTIVYDSVTAITPSGCQSANGDTHKGEVMICATGFDTSYIPRYPVIGPDGRNMQTEWAQSIDGYMGIGVSEFPNLFTFLGPYSPVSNGPTLVAIEAQADYICTFIDRYQTEPIHSMTPKATACAEFKAHVASFMERSVWTDSCHNSHNNHAVGGRIPTTWPGSTLHYLEAMRDVRADDWAIRYRGNRFVWLGIGISQTEWDPTADLGYYVRAADDGNWGSRWRRNAAISKSGSQPLRQLHRQPKLVASQPTLANELARPEKTRVASSKPSSAKNLDEKRAGTPVSLPASAKEQNKVLCTQTYKEKRSKGLWSSITCSVLGARRKMQADERLEHRRDGLWL